MDYPAKIGLFLLICATGWAQKESRPPSKEPSGVTSEALRTGSIIPHGQRQWKLIKQVKGSFGPLSNILLLESLKPTSTGGAGQPLSDVELLILQDGTILYDYVKEGVKPPDYGGTQFYMDDYLEIKDVTHDGVPEVLFHSGFEGASSSTTLQHILYYDKLGTSFADIAPAPFYSSGRHGFRWLRIRARIFAVIADENWPPTTPVEARCHYCPSPFQYDAYQWNSRKAAFEVYRRLYGRKAYSEAHEALDGDWMLIQSELNH